MSASLIPPDYLAVLRTLYNRLEETDIVWVLTGSLGLAIKGIPLTPHDIDIQTDRAGVYEFARIFADDLVQEPFFWETEHTQSWVAKFEIDGIQVEVMGDMRHRDEDGGWDDPPNLEAVRLYIQVAEMCVPTLSLDFEEEAYRSMGRYDKASLIGQYLRIC
jgi:hypothetical protein